MQPGAQHADLYHDVRDALRRALREMLARVAEQDSLDRLVQEILETREASRAPAVMPIDASAPVRASMALLTAREEQILARVAAGHSNKTIARTLDLSPHTIKRHVANILAKLGVSSRIQAATWLYDREVPSPGRLNADA